MELKDVIHLYLGCRVSTPIGEGQFTQYSVETGQCEVVYGVMGPDFAKVYDVSELMPALRPLSDMTEEEAREFTGWDKLQEMYEDVSLDLEKNGILIRYGIDTGDYVDYQSYKLSLSQFAPKEWIWLLSKGFDLFGLIESGQAIDKTNKTKKE